MFWDSVRPGDFWLVTDLGRESRQYMSFIICVDRERADHSMKVSYVYVDPGSTGIHTIWVSSRERRDLENHVWIRAE